MLLVNASAGPSRIHGQGLIARELIPAETVIWLLNPAFDVELTSAQFDELPSFVRQQVCRYVYTDMTTGRIVLCSDDAKYMNHADRPNTRSVGQQTVASADILPDEELTCDYREFDAGSHQLSTTEKRDIPTDGQANPRIKNWILISALRGQLIRGIA